MTLPCGLLPPIRDYRCAATADKRRREAVAACGGALSGTHELRPPFSVRFHRGNDVFGNLPFFEQSPS